MIRIWVLAALFSATCPQFTRAAEPEASGAMWSWVRKLNSEGDQDDTATALALADDSLWVGGQNAGKQYIQKCSLDGKSVDERLFLVAAGDGVNDLVAGSAGELFGVAEIRTSTESGSRPAYYFKRTQDGIFSGVRLATTEPAGDKGYADASAIDRCGQSIYVAGYFRPSDHAANKQAFFGTKSLSLSNLPTASFSDNSYKGFLVKIDADTDKVIWAKYLDCESAEAVRVDLQERVFVAGRGDGADGAGFVACYRGQDGTRLWSTSTITAANSIALDAQGSLWVIDHLDVSGYSVVLQKFYSDSGRFQRRVELLGALRGLAVAAHPSGGVVVFCHGLWEQDNGRDAGFRIYQLSRDGDILWSKHIFGGMPSEASWSKLVASRSSGDIFTAFSAASGSAYGPDSIFPEVSFEGYGPSFPFAAEETSSSAFVARLDSDFDIDLSAYFPPGGHTDPPGWPYTTRVFGPYDEDKFIYSLAINPVSADDIFYLDDQAVDDTSSAHQLFSGKTTLLRRLSKGSLFKVGIYNMGGSYGCTGALRVSGTRIPGVPSISTGVDTALSWVNTPFYLPITADESPTGFAALGLPQGLSINAFTGVISGKPSLSSAGALTKSVCISATNPQGVGYANLLLRVYGPPVITDVHPASGVAGDVVQIFGSELTGASAVTFNGQPAANPVITETCITVQVPVGDVSGKVAVTTPAGTASSQHVFTLLLPTSTPVVAQPSVQPGKAKGKRKAKPKPQKKAKPQKGKKR